MNIYLKTISEATGITDVRKLANIEESMRSDYFHSTLDWVTKDELQEAAKVCAGVLGYV